MDWRGCGLEGMWIGGDVWVVWRGGVVGGGRSGEDGHVVERLLVLLVMSSYLFVISGSLDQYL